MTRFYLNDKPVETGLNPATTLLDFIRYEKKLFGTKIGCREGDCGACTVLVGELKDDTLQYHSVTSCLMPVGNAAGKHILTIEGINSEKLNAVQEAFVEEGATQCGFCTPGFIVSLTGYCISGSNGWSKAIESMNGNICRCTGYKSIERAAVRVSELMLKRNGNDAIDFAINNNMIPPYIKAIPEQLKEWMKDEETNDPEVADYHVAGGTDLYVQKHESIMEAQVRFIARNEDSRAVRANDGKIEIGGAATVTDLSRSDIFAKSFPQLQKYVKLISSTQIRNMATIAGNFTNASPIGDLSVFFLALDAQLMLRESASSRIIPLRDFFIDYKVLAKRPGEIIEKIIFNVPAKNALFNFEKVSKRTHLDIASVNSAIQLEMDEQDIVSASLSAGGVAPVPLYLKNTAAFLTGKKISTRLVLDCIKVAMEEIAPISDARGSEMYKRLLLAQLIKAHFIQCFTGLPLQKLFTGS